MSIALVMNVYNDAAALRGALQTCLPLFDDAFILHAGPGGKRSNDGTIEVIEEFGVRHNFADIMDGFGKIRTRLIREARADFCLIMDADERCFASSPQLTCAGSEKYPENPRPKLRCGIQAAHSDHIGYLRTCLANMPADKMALRMCRRHWFQDPALWGSDRASDYRPCQSWSIIPDWQLRCIRTDPRVFFLPERKMHEHLKWAPTWEEPQWITGDQTNGPFVEHFHCHYKTDEQLSAKNAEDMATYKALDEGLTKGMWLEHAKGVKV